MNLDLVAFDDAVITRLNEAADGFRTVRPIESEERVQENSSDPLPAAYTLINGALYDAEEGNARYQDGSSTLTVFIKCRNLRGFGAAQTADDGAYVMIRRAVTALLGFAPAGCGYLTLTEIGAVRVTKTDAIYAIQFTANTSEDF